MGLRNSDRFNFDIKRAIAFGDNPAGNDRPLTFFEEQGMPFVSVNPDSSDLPTEECKANHVGGFEAGTAVVINELRNAMRPDVSSSILLGEVLPICKELLRSKL